MKKLKIMIASLFTAASVVLVPVSVGAVQVLPQCGANATAPGASGTNAICASKNDNISGIVKNVVNILLFIIGAISIVMLIVGGLRYTTSAGNSSQVTAAKNTIMYALIGLVIAVLAYAIVQFVIGAITTGKPA